MGYQTHRDPNHPLAVRAGRVLTHRAVLYDKLGGKDAPCHWCGAELTWVTYRDGAVKDMARALHADHVDEDPTNNDPDNLVPTCRRCNSHRGRRRENRVDDPQGELHECGYCGVTFRRHAGRGRPALYCSRPHRQRAYELRKNAAVRAVARDIWSAHGQECAVCRASLLWGDDFHIVERHGDGRLVPTGDREVPINRLRTVCRPCSETL